MKNAVKKSNGCYFKTKNYILFWFSGFNGLAGLYMFIGSLMYRGLYIFSPACGSVLDVVSIKPLPVSPICNEVISLPASICVAYFFKNGNNIKKDEENPANTSQKLSVHSDVAVPTNPERTNEKNTACTVVNFSPPVLLDGFSSTILLLVVGYPDMCSHPPLVSLSLTPKPLRCDLNTGYPMTIHQKERANA